MVTDSSADEIKIVLNWDEELKARVFLTAVRFVGHRTCEGGLMSRRVRHRERCLSARVGS